MTAFKRTSESPRKQTTAERTVVKKSKSRTKRARRKFLAVDVWQTQFGPVSERAIYDVYAQKFKVEQYNMSKYKFSHCVNALRRLEDPTYEDPQDASK